MMSNSQGEVAMASGRSAGDNYSGEEDQSHDNFGLNLSDRDYIDDKSSAKAKKKVLKSVLKRRYRNSRRRRSRTVGDYEYYSNMLNDYDDYESSNTIVSSSPLLTSTPAVVSKALLRLYPYLIIVDRFLNLLTWNSESDNVFPSVLLAMIFILTVSYFDFLSRYLGHLILIMLIWLYSRLDKYVNTTVSAYPTLDDIIHVMGRISQKADLIQAPITILNKQDIRRLLFTMTFFSPLYILITSFLFSPKTLLLMFGLYILTYYSPVCKRMRRFLWSFKLVRLFMFYLTGLNLIGLTNKDKNAFARAAEAVATVPNQQSNTDENGNLNKGNSSVKFTFVLYENQRRWLGIGWTSSMLSYERDPWTDEFLNPTSSPMTFHLPEDESDSNQWRWIDSNWKVDMTNDGAIQLLDSQEKLVSLPLASDGFLYYDNTWKSPSTEDTFTKYTRRRRWVRTAEYINTKYNDRGDSDSVMATNGNGITPINSCNNQDDKENEDNDAYESKENVDLSSPRRRRKVSFNETHKVHIIPKNSYMLESER